MALQAVLFDLDDTLLGNDTQRFVERYFSLLSAYAAGRGDGMDNLLPDLLASTRAVLLDVDRTATNEAVFWSVFAHRLGRDAAEMKAFFQDFYREQFPTMRQVTQLRPIARSLVRACFDRGLQVAIATHPLFPLDAIEQRLAWAGVPVTDFPYALITSYEVMHAAKPHRSYYQEILARLDCPPDRALMVGDDWENDMLPAATLGMRAYWVTDSAEPPNPTAVEAWGNLEQFYGWFVAGGGEGTRRA